VRRTEIGGAYLSDEREAGAALVAIAAPAKAGACAPMFAPSAIGAYPLNGAAKKKRERA
jgi:hypothetical protein